MNSKQTEIDIRYLLDKFTEELVTLQPETNINDLRIQVEQIQKRIEELKKLKVIVQNFDDAITIVELCSLADNLITDFDHLRIKFSSEYEKRQSKNPIRPAEAFLKFIYPKIADKIPELIEAELIEILGNKYNWLESQTLLCNLIMLGENYFDKGIADYFLIKGNPIKVNSLHAKFKTKTFARSFNRLKEVFSDTETPY